MNLSYRTKRIFIVSAFMLGFCMNAFPGNEQNKKQVKLTAYLSIADKYFNQYQYDSASIYYDSALFIAENISGQNIASHILRLKGTALRVGGQIDQALKILKESRQKAITINNDSICARADIELGLIYQDRGSLDSAEYFFQHALSDYERINDTIGIGRAKYNLSKFYRTKIDYETSLNYALECNRIFQRFNRTELYCRSLINLGNVYQSLKEYDTALACYDQCNVINIKLNNLTRAGEIANNKAVIYYRQKKYEEAKNELLYAIEFNERINDINKLSIFYRNISVIYKKLNQKDKALKYAIKALSIARQLDDKELLSDALINLGVYYKQNNNYKLAETHYLEGIKIAQKYDLKWDMKLAYKNITLLYKAKKDYKKAYDYLQKYSDITDSINSEEKIRAREKYKAEYELLHYKDQNRIKELEKKKMRFERNLSFGIGTIVVFLLIVILFFFRIHARKNRIIAAQRIQKLEDEKKLMAAQSVLVGQEKERERIARELHDGIGVLLSTASIHFSSVEEKSDKETSEMLKKANKLLKDASKEVRQISHNMMPGVLSKFGLKEAIEDLFEDVEDAGSINVNLRLIFKDERLAENMEIMIYRVIQEMLNNTIKHAKASTVSLSISRGDDEIIMDYMDDGVGFDEDKLPHGKNIGLSGIRSRIDYLGGTIALTSEHGKGTKYFISIPISKK